LEAFAALFDRFADARVVLLGEASHGTSEFYRARDAISRRLIERHGFNIVAVEADWPDAASVDRYVRHRPKRKGEEKAFERFPTWMWRNEEVDAFIRWLRRHNEAPAVRGDGRLLRARSLQSRRLDPRRHRLPRGGRSGGGEGGEEALFLPVALEPRPRRLRPTGDERGLWPLRGRRRPDAEGPACSGGWIASRNATSGWTPPPMPG
jgi:hypothetical protein